MRVCVYMQYKYIDACQESWDYRISGGVEALIFLPVPTIATPRLVTRDSVFFMALGQIPL